MSASDDRQWRIDNAHHLKGVTLKFRRYGRWSDKWDHDHCAACFAKLCVEEFPDVQHAGYATSEDYKLGACYDWVCSSCFADLKDAMRWVEPPPVTNVGNVAALAQFHTKDGLKVCSFIHGAGNLVRLVEETEIFEPDTPSVPAYWHWEETFCSGLYETFEAAEKEAARALPWLGDMRPTSGAFTND